MTDRSFILTVADADVDPPEKHFGPYTEEEAERVRAYLRQKLDRLGFVDGDPPYLWVTQLRRFDPLEDEYAITNDDSVLMDAALGKRPADPARRAGGSRR